MQEKYEYNTRQDSRLSAEIYTRTCKLNNSTKNAKNLRNWIISFRSCKGKAVRVPYANDNIRIFLA